MIEVELTWDDIKAARESNPTAPPEYLPGFALAKKGVRFKPTFSPLSFEHMVPPYEAWHDPETGNLRVRQGTPDDDRPASLDGLEVSDSDFGAWRDSGGTFNG